MMDTNRALTVKQLNFYAKSILDSDRNLRSVIVKGEISGFHFHERSGHAYFVLKDEYSSVRTVMFASYLSALSFIPENGMKVFVHGKVSLFERDGQFQFYADSITAQGIGESYAKFLALKEKLEKEGLFSSRFKKPIPKYPETVGVITSPTGAAIQDFINIVSRRFPSLKIVLYPVNVQGENAVPDVIRALSYFDEKHVDVVVITRGGGSYEDLAVFNDEALARKVFLMKTPVVSAVGHEIDFTIVDFVADLRAPTPSAAAEAVTPDRESLRVSLYEKRSILENILKNRIENERMRLSISFGKIDISALLKNESLRLDAFYDKILAAAKTSCNSRISNLEYYTAKINALNPLSVLSRGFSISIKDSKTLNSVEEIKEGDKFTVILKDGEIDCAAEKIRKTDNLRRGDEKNRGDIFGNGERIGLS